jgi:hypothetical protein
MRCVEPPKGRIIVNEGQKTSLERVYAGGDIVLGGYHGAPRYGRRPPGRRYDQCAFPEQSSGVLNQTLE